MAKQQPIVVSEYDAFARNYYEKLINGLVAKEEPFPTEQLRGWGMHFRQAYDSYQIDLEEMSGDLDGEEISTLFTKAAQSAAQSFKYQRNVNDNLNELLSAILDKNQETDDEEDDEEKIKPPAVAPTLPKIAALNYEEGKESRAWLDAWIEYSCGVLDGAPLLHVEGAGLFAISAVIARRGKIKGIMNKIFLTNMYIALASKSSSGKSSIAELAVKAITDLELYDELLIEGNWTPQLLTQRASGKVDASYANLDEEDRQVEEKRMVYAGMQSWFFDEFGKFLLRLNSQGNTQQTARLAELLLDWYYGKGKSQGSLTYGTDRVKEVYLSIIGCMTVSNVKSMQRMGNTFWEDGMFSRIVTLCPPIKKWEDVRISTGNEITPEEILGPLRAMHQWLGEPQGNVVEKDVGKGTTAHRLQREYWPEREIWANDEIRKLFENYFNATRRLASNPNLVPIAIESSYGRLAEYALKISGLFACINGRKEILRCDWIAAQEITERWRTSIHEFYEQVFEPQVSKERELEDRVYDEVKKKARENKWVTPNDLRRATGLSVSEISRYLNALADRKLIRSCQVPHPKHPKNPTTKWSLPKTDLPLGSFLPEEPEE